jgi:hypothetical protein
VESVSNNGASRLAKDDRAKQLLKKLEEGIEHLTTTEGYEDWLRSQALFHNYSWGNSLIIAAEQLQRGVPPEHVAGFHKWHEFDRRVRAGGKAIWILGPVTRKVVETDEETGEKVISHPLVGWKSVPVFTLSDTDGKPLPESPCHLLVGESNQAAQAAVVALIEREGYSFAISPATALGGANGVTTKETREVKVRDDISPLMTCKTSLHELAHIKLGHLDQLGTSEPICRGEAELQAESVAFCAMAALGLDSGDYSFGYLVHWQGGGDEAVKALKANAAKIAGVSNLVISELEAAGQEAHLQALQGAWEAASDQERALANRNLQPRLEAHKKAGIELDGYQLAELRAQSLLTLQVRSQERQEDDRAVRQMSQVAHVSAPAQAH